MPDRAADCTHRKRTTHIIQNPVRAGLAAIVFTHCAKASVYCLISKAGASDSEAYCLLESPTKEAPARFKTKTKGQSEKNFDIITNIRFFKARGFLRSKFSVERILRRGRHTSRPL